MKDNNRRIRVYRHEKAWVRTIISELAFFERGVFLSVKGDRVSFERPDLDYRGKVLNFHLCKISKEYRNNLVCDTPIGEYAIDEEESNEDRIVFYTK